MKLHRNIELCKFQASLVKLGINVGLVYVWSGLFWSIITKCWAKTHPPLQLHMWRLICTAAKRLDVMLHWVENHIGARRLLKSAATPGNQMLVSCRGRRGRWAACASRRGGRKISPRWKDVKVSSPQEHSDDRRGKTARVKNTHWK